MNMNFNSFNNYNSFNYQIYCMMQPQMMQNMNMQQNCMSSSQNAQLANNINNYANYSYSKKFSIQIKKVEYSDLNLIMNQNALEGFWDENEEIIGIIYLDKFNKIKNNITLKNKGEKENKIIYTIVVLYFLKTKLSMKLNVYKLVIHKAEKFLKDNGIDYDDIVSDIN